MIQEANAQDNAGEPATLVFTSLLTYLIALFARGGSFTKFMPSKHAQCPSSPSQPWKLIIYLDELIPGNVLGRAERKSWAWCASFLAMSNKVSKTEAGVSQITATLLEAIFCNPMCYERPKLIYQHQTAFCFSMVLADGAAHKQVWTAKGGSGSKFCFLCKNVRASGTHEDQMHCNIAKYSQLKLTTDQEVLQSYAKLDARKATCTKADFDMWQQATGLTHSHLALLLDAELKAMDLLKPVAQFAHDPVHGVLQGIAPICLFHWLSSMGNELDIWTFLQGYFPLWQYPKSWKTPELGTFVQKKKTASYKSSQKISCQASECLAIFPIVRHVVHQMANPQSQQPKACEALLAMANLIDQIQDGNLAGLISRDTLLQATEHAIESFKAAWPEIPLIKKWHWQLHVGDTHERFGRLVSCFANERKHKPIGQLAQALQNQKNFERNLLEQVLSQEICKLDQPDVFRDGVYLISLRPASKSTLQTLTKLIGEPIGKALVSWTASVNHTLCHKGDVVLYQINGSIAIAQVHLHLLIHGILTTLVNAWHIQEWMPKKQFAKCQVPHQILGFVPTADILVTVICHQSQGNAKVLLPYQIYSKEAC